ncbi:class I SAM-dependent methyltransferase [Maribacter sp. 2308TA10-17]|uniref:class I SAM-dependent methyltransferase n=1 Tax=Maribacter sp. 2308TA10-17 TaxID=3386276 RepID=UPI0039BD0544
MKTDAKNLNLLPLKDLIKTGDVDHADWNYRPFLGTISCSRFRLIKKLLVEKHGERLLEIGYGSGVFLPELSKHADEICGVDIHDKPSEVAEKLLEFDIKANLISSGAEKMEWEDNSFDFVVAVSALEFVSDLDAVCSEVKRILKPSGSFMVVTPGQSPILDFGLKVLTGKSAKKDFADRREIILPTLHRHFKVKQELTYPKTGASLIKLYTALELIPNT